MTKIQDIQLKELLPSNLTSDEVDALSCAIKNATTKVCAAADRIRVIALIDEAPEEIVDYLAVEFNSPYYDQTLDLSVKRNVVKNTLARYAKVGTPGIIKDYLASMGEEVEILEWQDYGGKPYHFSIYVTMPHDSEVTPELVAETKDKISKLKNLRSIMDELQLIKQIADSLIVTEATASALVVERHIGETENIMFLLDNFTFLVDRNEAFLAYGNSLITFDKEE